MEFFVNESSIVRKIWGKADTVLFIFAGAAAEFALNKAVDWLYYTGKLPSDPLKRLFSTVTYARDIVFSEKNHALHTIDKIAAIHKGVETSRGTSIPDWAYRDVLYMLIDYSIRSYEVLERKLTIREKEEVFNVFFNVGTRMGLSGLPKSFGEWTISRNLHLENDLIYSAFTKDLLSQYQKHLGTPRYLLLIEVQILIAPARVKDLLKFRSFSLIHPLLYTYKATRLFNFHNFLKNLLMPVEYRKNIRALDV